MTSERGFTLIETLIVLFIAFTLLFVTSALFFKVDKKIAFDTYVQQFKLLNYETYSLAGAKQQQYVVLCDDKNPSLLYRYPQHIIRSLDWPSYMKVQCFTDSGQVLAYNRTLGIEHTGSVYFSDTQANRKVKYSANFTYGRLRYVEESRLDAH